jgi:phosphatidylglycerophosphate synthase
MSIRSHFPRTVAIVIGPFGRGLARLGVTPNTLTTAGLVLTVAAAIVVAQGDYVVGGVLLLLGGAMDTFDGAVARVTGRSTPFGGFYDSVSDRISDGVVLAGLAWSLAARPRELLLVLVALVGAQVTSYVRARAESIDLECSVGILERAERALLLILALLVAPLLEPILWILAVGGIVTVTQRIHHVWCQIDRDLPEELLALARADRAWSRPFIRASRAFYGQHNFDEAFGEDLTLVLGEPAVQLRERLSARFPAVAARSEQRAEHRAERRVERQTVAGDGPL